MIKSKINNTSSLKSDLSRSMLIGLLAGLFAIIVLINLNLLGKQIAGVEISIPLTALFFISLCVFGLVLARAVGRFLPVFYKFGKFGEVGGLNWLVDLGIVNLLILLTGFSAGAYFIVFKGISFIMASINSFFWNKHWVFVGGKKQKESQEIGKFALATTLGMLVNVIIAGLIAYLGPHLFGGIETKTWANIATISGSLTAMAFNFIVYKIWVFKS